MLTQHFNIIQFYARCVNIHQNHNRARLLQTFKKKTHFEKCVLQNVPNYNKQNGINLNKTALKFNSPLRNIHSKSHSEF